MGRDSVSVYLGNTPMETLDMMHITSKGCFVGASLIYKCHRRYIDEFDSVYDDARSGRQVTHKTSADILSVKFAMDSYRSRTVEELKHICTFLCLSVFARAVTSRTALLIIDVQNCFLPGGGLAVADGESVIPVINTIRSDYDFDLTVLSQDWHCPDHVSFASQHAKKDPYAQVTLDYDRNGQLCNSTCDVQHSVVQTLWPDHCVMGTNDANFSSQLTQRNDDVIIKKGFLCHIDSYSAFYDNGGFSHTQLDAILKQNNIDTVVVTGLALDYCVYYTSKDAYKLGYKVYTVLDASRPVANATMETALQDLRQKGVHLIQSADLNTVLETSAGIMTSPVVTWTILSCTVPYFLLAITH